MPYLGNRPDNIVIRNAQQEFNYTATSSQTTFTGLDTNNNTLAYNPGNVEVFFNGARLEESDFTATNGTSIVLASAAATNDLVSIISTDVFEVTDTVSRQNGGTFIGDVTMSGNLTVNGTTTSVNSNEVNIGDNILKLNSDETGTPSQNAGIEVERGSATNVAFRWNETTDKWQFTNDGSSYIDLGESDLVGDTTPQLGGNLESNGNNIKLADSDQIVLGSDNDANIKHTGTNLNINETTGEINIRTYADDQDVVISTDDGSGGITNYIRADGSTGEVKLYHYGSEKIKTTTTGATVTGVLVSDGLTVDTSTLKVDSSNNRVGVGTASPSDTLHVFSSTTLDHIKADGPAGINRNLEFATAGTTRWNVYTNSNSESGSNAGSNFSIARYADNGSFIGVSVFIDRSTGNVGIGQTSPGTSLHIKDAITNPNTISSNMTIPASSNSMMAGPITLNATLTIPSGSSWTIV